MPPGVRDESDEPTRPPPGTTDAASVRTTNFAATGFDRLTAGDRVANNYPKTFSATDAPLGVSAVDKPRRRAAASGRTPRGLALPRVRLSVGGLLSPITHSSASTFVASRPSSATASEAAVERTVRSTNSPDARTDGGAPVRCSALFGPRGHLISCSVPRFEVPDEPSDEYQDQGTRPAEA